MLKVGFGNHAWTARFIANSLEYAVMARRIGENDLAKSFEDQAERAQLICDRADAGLRLA